MSTGARPVALVTGSRKGIGRHLARHLASTGYQVVGCSRGPAEWSMDGYEHVTADVTDEADVVRLLAVVRQRHGGLSVLVNNAGVASMNALLLTPGTTVDQIIRTNLIGTILIARESAKLMLKSRFGRIVNFTSVAVALALEGEAVYAASKGGVEAFTRVLARELGPSGITVNAVGPGPITTDLTRGVPAPKLEALARRLSTGRASSFEDVENVVDFLIAPESGAVTGQTIYLGGP
ncbi:MAG TPA: SDR family oxidoreductase [Thermoanaerobaculia bacterium]|nr:SDR family oxidoreductase [Thermoanaerobaculia bacterium]